ncbi:MAG: exodeoxyribonuclease VII small subunit [Clostridium cadaveris]|uniref:Exodeoxyribonuclease 7 small subunit n=1 Tax=Clostridium cadaveris TaxID=1529 RepID=A0A316M8L5_9CLOT|nr:MAG: exodeoxyribonuclease VII small subunit [Clostridium cadaveris]
MAKKAEKYEDNLKKLRDIVNIMDKNELPLEEAMKKYEEGIKLCNKLYATLKNYEEKILILNNEDKEEEFKEI